MDKHVDSRTPFRKALILLFLLLFLFFGGSIVFRNQVRAHSDAGARLSARRLDGRIAGVPRAVPGRSIGGRNGIMSEGARSRLEAADDHRWSNQFGRPGFDARATSFVEYQGSLIAGGDFSLSDSTALRHLARWSGTGWEPFASGLGAGSEGPCIDGEIVGDMVLYNGDLVVGGSFVEAGGVTVNGIARWDGNTWHPLGSGISQAPGQTECTGIKCLAVFQDLLVAGGVFDNAGGIPVDNLAVWDGNSWSALGGGRMGTVFDLEVLGTELIAACDFYFTGQELIYGVVRWDGIEWRPLGLGLDGPAVVGRALVVYEGELILGGQFELAGGLPASHIARWDGANWSALGSGLSYANLFFLPPVVNALAVYEGSVIAAGEFTGAGGVSVGSIARWDGSSWSDLDFGVENPTSAATVAALAVHDSTLIAGGDFTRAGDVAANYVAQWNGAAWTGMGTPGLGADGLVLNMVEHQGALLVSGFFKQVGNMAANDVARWNGSEWSPMDAGLKRDSTGVFAMVTNGTDLYAAVGPTMEVDSTANHVVTWNVDAWQHLGSGMNGYISTLAFYGGDLVAGGVFTRAGGTPASGIARWDGADWQALGTGFGATSYTPEVRAIQEYQGELVAAGTFEVAGGVPANHVARWDGSAWKPLGTGLQGATYAHAYDLDLYGDLLVVTGDFNRAGDVDAGSVAFWDGNAWSAPGAGVSSGGRFTGLVAGAVSVGNELFVTGLFDRAGSAETGNIARWDGNSWSALGSGLNTIGVRMAIWGGDLYVGGWFTAAGGKQSSHFARWRDVITPIALSDLRATSDDDGVVLSWSLSDPARLGIAALRVHRSEARLGPYVVRTPEALAPGAQMQFRDFDVESGRDYWYRIEIESRDGARSLVGPIQVHVVLGAFSRTELRAPLETADGSIQIRYSVGPRRNSVRLGIYDARGRELWAPGPEPHAPGAYTRIWSRLDGAGQRVPRGVYFVSLRTEGAATSRKLVLLVP